MRSSRTLAEHFAAFAATNDALDDIRGFVQSALTESTLGHKTIAGLLLAVEEAVTNVIRHGYLYGEGRIWVRVRRNRRRVEIVLADTGRPYDGDFNAIPDPNELARTGRRGGLGLLLLRKVTDEIDYRREGNRNSLTLVKYTRPGLAGAARGSRVRRRIAWAGAFAVVVTATVSAFVIDRRVQADVAGEFLTRWRDFGAAAAASAGQMVFSGRSDAELDQLVVDLKTTATDLQELVVLDPQNIIRAHSEHPERVRDGYEAPLPADPSRNDLYSLDGQPIFAFTSPMVVGGRTVGNVTYTVGREALRAEQQNARMSLVIWTTIAIVVGELLVFLIAFGVSRPLYRLTEILQRAQTDGRRPEAGTDAPDELQKVLAAMNEVTEAVARTEKQMAQKELAQREIEQSEQLQRALLPQAFPCIPGYDLAGMSRMARHVGGDYYDVVPLNGSDDRWLIIVADVAGKGFPAALMMTALRTAVRLLAPHYDSPDQILVALDRYLKQHHQGAPFVTAMAAVLEPRKHHLRVASAGHVPGLYQGAEKQQVREINPLGRPLGLPAGREGEAKGLALECWDCDLQDGDSLVFYTDGVSEAVSPQGSTFGPQGLTAALRLADCGDAVGLLDHLMGEFERFADGAPVADDFTILVLRRATRTVEVIPGNGNSPKSDAKPPEPVGPSSDQKTHASEPALGAVEEVVHDS